MKILKLITILILITLISGCLENDEYGRNEVEIEYKVYDVIHETNAATLFESYEIFYTVYYIDGDYIETLSGSSDDRYNLIRYKVSNDDTYKLIKTVEGIYYDEWDLYLPNTLVNEGG